jgi:hypothetical protein
MKKVDPNQLHSLLIILSLSLFSTSLYAEDARLDPEELK